MLVTHVPIGQIKPNERNPRHLQDAVKPVAESIREFGFLVPIVVNDSRTILAGHARYEAAKLLGLKNVPVVSAGNLTEAQQKAFMIADNKTAEYARFDTEKLVEVFKELDELGYEMTNTGFTDKEIDALSEGLKTIDDELDCLDEGSNPSDKGDAREIDVNDVKTDIVRVAYSFSRDEQARVAEAIHKMRDFDESVSESSALAQICDYYLRSNGE